MCEMYQCKKCRSIHTVEEYIDYEGQCPECGNQVLAHRPRRKRA